MKKVLIDANVALDVLLKREGLYEASDAVISLCQSRLLDGYISVTCLPVIFHWARKNEGTAKAKLAVKKVTAVLKPVGITAEETEEVVDSDYNDLEDALIGITARRIKADAVISRNKRDFKGVFETVLTPEEFMQILKH